MAMMLGFGPVFPAKIKFCHADGDEFLLQGMMDELRRTTISCTCRHPLFCMEKTGHGTLFSPEIVEKVQTMDVYHQGPATGPAFNFESSLFIFAVSVVDLLTESLDSFLFRGVYIIEMVDVKQGRNPAWYEPFTIELA